MAAAAGTIGRALAKKSRTPAPPRRPVQAPQRRVDSRDPESRRALWILVGIAAAGLLILGGLLAWLSLKGDDSASGSSGLAATMSSAGCTYRTWPSEGRKHVADGTLVKYKSTPVPTSGSHYATPAIWNAYDQPVEESRIVHNLEHGGIVVQYGNGVPEDTVADLNSFYQDDPGGMILAPLPRLGNRIAISAWTHVASCTKFDEGAFEKFRDDFRYKGPEKISPEFMNPGQ